MGKSDKTALIDDEYRPLRISLAAQDTVTFSYTPVWPEIAQQREADSSQALRPGLQTWYVVYADAQDLGIIPRKFSQIGFI